MNVSWLKRLEDAGFNLAELTEEQRQVLAALAAEEVDLLVGIKQRLDDVEGDVEGHGFGDSGGVYW